MNSLVTTYTIIGVTSGAAYKFQVRAKNIYGYGTFSTVSTIYASTVPNAMAAPTVATVSTNVQISWVIPSNGGAAVDYYEVQIYSPNSATMVDSLTYCNG